MLGYPTTAHETIPGGGWYQRYQHGIILDSQATTTQMVADPMWTTYAAAGSYGGVLGFPTTAEQDGERGSHQEFQGGQLWALRGKPARLVRGAVLDAWRAAGGATGSYGYPVSDTTENPDGTLTCAFEGGDITA